MKKRFCRKMQCADRRRGFTLIEVLVSIFIISIITGTAVYSHREFTDSLEITNLSYDIALTIRDVQARTSAGETAIAQGVHFNLGTNANFFGSNTHFVKFIDSQIPADYVFARSGYSSIENCNNEECEQVINIGRGNFIEKICYVGSDGSSSCFNGTNGSIVGVDISYKRPKTEANIRFRNSTGNIVAAHNDKTAIVCLTSPIGRKKSIKILSSGQISVNQGCN